MSAHDNGELTSNAKATDAAFVDEYLRGAAYSTKPATLSVGLNQPFESEPLDLSAALRSLETQSKPRASDENTLKNKNNNDNTNNNNNNNNNNNSNSNSSNSNNNQNDNDNTSNANDFRNAVPALLAHVLESLPAPDSDVEMKPLHGDRRATWPLVVVLQANDSSAVSSLRCHASLVALLPSRDGDASQLAAKVVSQRVVWRRRWYELAEFYGSVALDADTPTAATTTQSTSTSTSTLTTTVNASTTTTAVAANANDDDNDAIVESAELDEGSVCLVCLSAGRCVAGECVRNVVY